jgi:hypothetical protein
MSHPDLFGSWIGYQFDWNTPSNRFDGAIPTSSTDVKIFIRCQSAAVSATTAYAKSDNV